MDVVCDCEVESKGDISGRSSAVLKTFRNWEELTLLLHCR
jgi:hypothetical protein